MNAEEQKRIVFALEMKWNLSERLAWKRFFRERGDRFLGHWSR